MQDIIRPARIIREVPDAPTDPDAFLEWSSRQPRGRKFELSRGKVIEIMINVTRRHALVCSNLAAELRRLLNRTQFLITTADFAVRTPFGIRGPDVLVEPVNPDLSALSSSDPVLLAEVLSPSTVGIDLMEKVEEYTAIPSLQAYLICSQDLPLAWFYAREGDAWPKKAREIAGRDQAVPVPALGIELAMAAIYEGIPDPPQP
jgi:Uma2 family endonuclease